MSGWRLALGLFMLSCGAFDVLTGTVHEYLGEHAEATVKYARAAALLCLWLSWERIFKGKD